MKQNMTLFNQIQKHPKITFFFLPCTFKRASTDYFWHKINTAKFDLNFIKECNIVLFENKLKKKCTTIFLMNFLLFHISRVYTQ